MGSKVSESLYTVSRTCKTNGKALVDELHNRTVETYVAYELRHHLCFLCKKNYLFSLQILSRNVAAKFGSDDFSKPVCL